MLRTPVSQSSAKLRRAAVDEIIASCNGDLRGAVKALMLLNEQLELELRQLHAVDASGSLRELRTKIAFH